MPPLDSSSKVTSGINVTPLVDVVLVLLIIFMVIAPQLQTDAPVELPRTERPPDHPDDGRLITVTIEADGSFWIDDRPVEPERFEQRMREAAADRPDWRVVIKGDSRLRFGQVQSTMFAVESAGFGKVGLITERREEG